MYDEDVDAVEMNALICWSTRASILGALWLPACSEDDSRYHKVAQGRYAEIWQSDDLEGRVCPDGAPEIDRQIEELATALRVSVPDDYRVIARLESGNDAASEACGDDRLGGCVITANDAAGSPLMISPQYVWGHEVVHAVQRLREGRPHRALLEGEARMFEDIADVVAILESCPPQRVSEARIREALEDALGPGNYSVFQEMVVRVYQDYGPAVFDALWAASAEDPSTEGLLAAFENVLGTTLFELMERHSWTCRDHMPGCAGLERFVMGSDVLTIAAPETCAPGITGLDTSAIDTECPGRLVRNLVLELPVRGELTVSFTGSGWASVQVAACGGFDDGHGYGFYTSRDEELGGEPRRFDLEPGLYRAVVLGTADGLPMEAHFQLAPSG